MAINDFITITATAPKTPKEPKPQKAQGEKKENFFKRLFKRREKQEPVYETPTQESDNMLFGSSLLYTDNPNDYGGQFANVLGGQTLANRSVLVKKLQNEQDMGAIVSNLRQGDPCVVSLDGVEIALAQRYVDFLSGVIVALNGTIKQLDMEKYLLTPNGLGIK